MYKLKRDIKYDIANRCIYNTDLPLPNAVQDVQYLEISH